MFDHLPRVFAISAVQIASVTRGTAGVDAGHVLSASLVVARCSLTAWIDEGSEAPFDTLRAVPFDTLNSLLREVLAARAAEAATEAPARPDAGSLGRASDAGILVDEGQSQLFVIASAVRVALLGWQDRCYFCNKQQNRANIPRSSVKKRPTAALLASNYGGLLRGGCRIGLT